MLSFTLQEEGPWYTFKRLSERAVKRKITTLVGISPRLSTLVELR
jgi:hypothetical protein